MIAFGPAFSVMSDRTTTSDNMLFCNIAKSTNYYHHIYDRAKYTSRCKVPHLKFDELKYLSLFDHLLINRGKFPFSMPNLKHKEIFSR